MGVLTAEERRTLIDLLLSVPNVEDPAARRLLTANLPRRLLENIPFSDTTSIHIANIVDTVTSDAWAYLPDGSAAAATVITNAAQMVDGSSLAAQFTGLLTDLKARPVPPPPAQAAASQEDTPPARADGGVEVPHPASAGAGVPNIGTALVQQGGIVLGGLGTILAVIVLVASGDLRTAIPVGFPCLMFWLLAYANRNPLYLRIFAAIICVVDLLIAVGFATYASPTAPFITLTALVFLAASVLLTIKYTQQQPPS
jgi:hypothetical protein